MIYKEIETRNNKQIAYVRTNEWKEDIILFFHGFFGSKMYFPDTENEDVCIVSFDRPGIGESSVEEYYRMEDFLESSLYMVGKGRYNGSTKIYWIFQKRI